MSTTNKQKRELKNRSRPSYYNKLKNLIDSSEKRLLQKFSALASQVQQGLNNLNTQLVTNSNRQDIVEQVIEQLDVNSMVIANITKECYGKLEQMDAYLKQIANQTEWQPEELNLEDLKRKATEAHEAIVQNCYRLVMEEREEEINRRREEAKKQHEQKTAEQELKEAENSKLTDNDPGGEGSDIPSGADVFGG